MADLDDVKSNNRDRRPRMSDMVSTYEFPANKWVTLRVLPGIHPEAMYWVKTKKRDGKMTKFPTPCPSFDPATQQRDSTKYDPWRDLQSKERELVQAKKLEKDATKVQFSVKYWMIAIDRAAQKRMGNGPKPTRAELKSGFKDKDSDTLTAKTCINVSSMLAEKLKGLKELNLVESSKTGNTKMFAVNDLKFGRDVRVKYNPEAPPAAQYEVAMAEKRSPITEEEMDMLSWDLDTALAVEFNDKEVKADFESWASRNGVKLSKKAAAQDEEDGDGDEDEDEDEDGEGDDFDDEDEAPKPKKKVAAKSSKKAPAKKSDDFDDEDDEEDLDEDDDEEEEEAPKSKKKAPAKSKAPAKKSTKRSDDFDDEDDEDEDDLDEDDEEEEEAPKSKKKVVAKKPPANKAPAKKSAKKSDDFDDEDDEDEDDDLDEEDDDEDGFEEEAPKSKKKVPVKAAKKAPVTKAPAKKSKSKKSDDFDDDEEDEDGDDEEEDDDIPF
jgi:hypothetical protein